MNDMSKVIVPKSDQINADDLISGPVTIRITEVDIRPGTEQPVSIYFDGDEGKPWRPCKSMSRVLVAAWGPDAKAYIGRSVTLYRDPKVKWGGMEVGGIRISHLSHIERDMVMALTATKGKRAPYTVKPLVVQQQQPTLTIDQATADMNAAMTMDELRAVWTRKVMIPHQKALAGHLATLKAQLSGEGPADSQRGEVHNDAPTLEQAKQEIDDAQTPEEIDAALQRLRPQMATDEDGDDLALHADARRAEVDTF